MNEGRFKKSLIGSFQFFRAVIWRLSVLGWWGEVSSLLFAPYFWAWTAKTCWRTSATSSLRLDLGLLVKETDCGWLKNKKNLQSLKIIISLFNYDIAQSVRDVHSHTCTAALSLSGKDIKPGHPVPYWSYVTLLTHQQSCIFVSVWS